MEVFAENSSKTFGPFEFQSQKNVETKCVLCEDSFNLELSIDLFLKHLLDVHGLVIEDVQNIEDLQRYLTYWRQKFLKVDIESIIPTISVDSSDRKFFLLSSLTKDDQEIRHKIRLDHVLQIHEFERSDTNFMKGCLFCRLTFEGKRTDYVAHLSSQHNLHLGKPQNLVYIEELIDKIEQKLKELKCLFCEKTFSERNVLKEHMRKKIHKRINPQNKEYDKFYIINYLEPGKSWQAIQKEDDSYAISAGNLLNSDEEYSDGDELEVPPITCLFCPHKEKDINVLCLHMEANHNFDFANITKNYDFYLKIKLVNYIRKQMLELRCLYCDANLESSTELENHIDREGHCKIPNTDVFDQAIYYFPTYEDDAFLYNIDDVDD